MENTKVEIKKHVYSKLDRSRFLFCFLCILIPVAHLCVFYIYININTILLAFQTDLGEFTLDNFRMVFEALSGNFQPWIGLGSMGVAIGNSVKLWLWSQLLIFPVSLISTYVLFRGIHGHYVYRVIFMIPSIIGGSIWISCLQRVADYNGILVQICNTLGIKLDPLVENSGFIFNPNTSFSTMIAFTVFGVVGGNAVLTGSMARVPGEIFESARIDGAGFWRECVQVAIPCVGPTITTMLTFSLCTFFTADCNAYLYTRGAAGNYNAETMGFYMFKMQEAITQGFGYTYPSAVGMFMTMITMPFVLIGRWLLEKLLPVVDY